MRISSRLSNTERGIRFKQHKAVAMTSEHNFANLSVLRIAVEVDNRLMNIYLDADDQNDVGRALELFRELKLFLKQAGVNLEA